MHIASGWQVALSGSNANNSANARLAYLNANNASSNANSNIGRRHCNANPENCSSCTTSLPLGKTSKCPQLLVGKPKATGQKKQSVIRYGNLFEQVYSAENLWQAHVRARKGKGHYTEVQKINRDPERYLGPLQRSLREGTYRTSEYSVSLRKEGRKMREIYRLPYFPDRIVHHAVMNVVEGIWMKSLIRDTYQSLPGRGVHLAAERIRKALREDEDGTRYCLKIDVRKFYPSVDNGVMKRIVRKKIKDKALLALLDEIIDSTTGLPIGNYLSQIFGNLYLSEFDHWMKEEKRVRWYFRYCDDLVAFGADKTDLHQLRREISEYLADRLKLEVKGNWQVFPVDVRGVDVVGYRFFRDHTLLRKSIADGFKRKVRRIERDWESMSSSQIINGLMSYTGWMKYADCAGLKRAYLTKPVRKIAEIACTKAEQRNPVGSSGSRISLSRQISSMATRSASTT